MTSKTAISAPVSQEILDDLVRRVRQIVDPIRIILFGSHASGMAGTESDIDILVVVPENMPRRRTAQRIYRNLIGFDFAVDALVATPTDLERYGNNFSLAYYDALREGIEIYARKTS